MRHTQYDRLSQRQLDFLLWMVTAHLHGSWFGFGKIWLPIIYLFIYLFI